MKLKRIALFILILSGFVFTSCDDNKPQEITLIYLPLEFDSTEESFDVTSSTQKITIEFNRVKRMSSEGITYKPVSPIPLMILTESTAVYGEHYAITDYDNEKNLFTVDFINEDTDSGDFFIDIFPDKITEHVSIDISDAFNNSQTITINLVPATED